MLLLIFKIISTAIKGILIGICLSAPLGPVGTLCLKKTLYEGRQKGLLTGYGATISDMFYSALVYFGFGYMLTFLEEKPEIMLFLKSFGGVLGGIILIIFARILYNKARTKTQKEQIEDNIAHNSKKEVLNSFLLTVSNLWIVFLIWSLYMSFSFVQPLDNLPAIFGWKAISYMILAIIAVLGIGGGCLLWWYFFTDVIIRVSKSLGPKGIKWFVYMISIILSIVGIFGIIIGLEAIISWSEVLYAFKITWSNILFNTLKIFF